VLRAVSAPPTRSFLIGWDVERLLRQVEQSCDRALARINGRAKVGARPAGNNSVSELYRPNTLAAGFKGQTPALPSTC
jgi:hypothetical protein